MKVTVALRGTLKKLFGGPTEKIVEIPEGSTCEDALLAAGIDFTAFSRTLICQPDLIARMKRGETDESACLACNGCYRVYRQRPVRCVQHQEPIPQLEKVFFA